MNTRAAAALALNPVLKQEHSLQSSFDKGIGQVPPKDKGLYHELVLGTLRKYEYLDNIAHRLLSKKLKQKDSDVYALILLGLHQLIFMRVPDHAAISETVTATKTLKKHWAKNLVNAVLRNFQRRSDELIELAKNDLCATWCLPDWLINELETDWRNSFQTTATPMQFEPPLTARVNTSRISISDAMNEICDSGLKVSKCPHSTTGMQIEGVSNVQTIPGFNEGWLSIQDEAAQLAAELMELSPMQHVLDACAAPGGKTAALLEAEPELTELIAIELEEGRIPRIHDSLERLRLKAKVICADASNIKNWWNGKLFDRILLDAPCSATGVIRRHPDIKLLRRKDDLASLAATQKLLLNTLWKTLKPGGILLYATCSVLKKENELQLSEFLKSHEDAREVVIDAEWGVKRPVGRQLFPQMNGHDGFYYAKLMKL